MSIVKKIEIDGQDVLFTSAAIPRIYRLKFQRDIYKDLRILEKSIGSIRSPFIRCCRSLLSCGD